MYACFWCHITQYNLPYVRVTNLLLDLTGEQGAYSTDRKGSKTSHRDVESSLGSTAILHTRYKDFDKY